MEIIVAKKAGFCFGVKRAIKIAYDTANKSEGEVATIGPLIHNPQVVSHLENKGVRAVKEVGDFDGEAIIVRSHGVSKTVIKSAEEAGLRVVDATCPFVKKAQDYAHLLHEEGYTVVIVGDQDHPEVKGILGYAGTLAVVASCEGDMSALNKVRKIGIVAQTTTTFRAFKEVVSRCLEVASEVKVYNTICDATHIRQKEAQEIARHVDIMFVLGGRNSGNTTRLAELCRLTGTRTFHIETQEEIDPAWLEKVGKVGVTAGASTPNWIIRGVLERLERLSTEAE